MWRIICLFSLVARALSAPSGCIELCNSQNLQSYQNINCCGLPMVVPSNIERNHTNHNDFETVDGALVHKKDGTFFSGNTHGSFNEMSYYKETGGGINQNFGTGFENTFGNLQHSGSNFASNQKTEDFGSSFHNSFETMFASRYSGLMQSVRDSLNHLKELKQKGQLQTQECQEPCVPIYQQIDEAQRQWASQKQQMDRVREQLWSQYLQQQQQHTTRQVNPAPVQQQPYQVVYPAQIVQTVQPVRLVEHVQTAPQQTVKKEWHQKWEHSQQTETRPQMITKVTYPVRITEAQQTHGRGSSNQVYQSGVTSTTQQGIYGQNQLHGSGIQSQVGYDQGAYGSETYGSQAYGSQSHGTETHGSQTYGSQTHRSQGYGSQTHESQGYGSQAHGSQARGSQSYESQSHGSQGYGTQIHESQRYGSQTHGSQMSHSMSQHADVGFGSTSGGLLTETIAMGPNPDCNEESHYHQSYSQKRYKRASPSLHHQVHHGAEVDDLGQETQQVFDTLPVQQATQDYPHHSIQREDFGEPAKLQKVSQQEIEALGQQVEDFRHGKFEAQDLTQQSEDLTQQNQDLTQQSGKLEFGQELEQHPSQIESLSQKNRQFDDYSQHSGKIEFGQEHQQNQDLTQQSHGFEDYFQQSGKLVFGQDQQHPSQIESLSQQSQDFTQQSHGFDDYFQHSQIESLSQKTQGFGVFPKPEKLEQGQGVQKLGRSTGIEDLTQQSQTVSDFSQYPRGLDQHTVGNLKLDQLARDFHDFNQFPTPVLAPDRNRLGNQRFEGLNQQFNVPLKPAPKPTSRPTNPKSTQLSLGKNSNADKIFNMDQTTENSRDVQVEWGDEVDRQSPFENLKNTGRGDISAENADSPTDGALTPHEVSDTQVGYQKSLEERYHEDFGQQVQKPGGLFQHVQRPRQDFSHDVQGQNRDFFQQVKWEGEDFSQEVQKPRKGFSQQAQKHHEDVSQQVQKTRQDFSPQFIYPHDDFSQQIQRPYEEVDQRVQKSHEDFSQQYQKPHKDFSQQVQGPREDYSQISDLSSKDITQLPQEPRGGLIPQSHQFQDKLTGHNSETSQQTQQISLGNQWHRSHNPGDLPNENLQEDRFSDQIQQRQQRQDNEEGEQTRQIEQIPRKQEKDDRIIFDQQKTQSQLGTWEQQMSREVEVIRDAGGKLEFGQSVQNQRSNSQLSKEKTTEISLQPRILEAYGGRGPYDPIHGDDIFNGARLNPSATLPPFIDGDPWDIREKPLSSPVMNDDKVIPLDTTWVFPDAIPNYTTTAAPKPGFWGRVSRRFSTAVDKAKEKARDIFG